MSKPRRKFTAEDRLSILQECGREGQTATCRKYNLAASLIQRWKQKYQARGVKGLRAGYQHIDPEVRALQEENERLKKIVARQAIEIEFKSELIKHSVADPFKKKRQ